MAMDVGRLLTVQFLVIVMCASSTDALVCYFCPRTSAGDDNDANIECLAFGLEFYCAPDQDRCYSSTYTSPPLVTKGCINSTYCVGRTACCQTDLCNADPVNSLAGYGNPCSHVSSCIQGPDVMTCDPRSSGDRIKLCLCRNNSYRRGATCRRKSLPDERCSYDYHCLDGNSSCARGRCKCGLGRYPNGTRCDHQKHLGENCTVNKECYGSHTQCNGQCICRLGYLKEQRTNTSLICSGETRTEKTIYLVILTVIFVFIIPNISHRS